MLLSRAGKDKVFVNPLSAESDRICKAMSEVLKLLYTRRAPEIFRYHTRHPDGDSNGQNTKDST